MNVRFGDGTYCSFAVGMTGRSGTFSRLHITELALVCRKFPDKAREILEGSIPSVPMSGRVDIESTADGSDGKFYDMFWEAWERGQPTLPTEYKAHFYNWQWDEEIENIEPLKSELIHFRECVRENKPPLVDGEEALRTLEVAFEIMKKIREGVSYN